jgi:antitoxin VapB
VFISRAGEKVILSPKPTSWDAFFEATERPTADFMAERVDELAQGRELL